MQLVNASGLARQCVHGNIALYGTCNLFKSPPKSFCEVQNPRLYADYYKPFALAIEDIKNSRVLLVRDHFGVMPLFYCIKDHELIFSDNLPDIIKHLDSVPVLVDSAVQNLFSDCRVYQDTTLYKDIYRVEPGHIYTFSKNAPPKKEPFWQLDPEASTLAYQTEEDYLDAFEDLLNAAVKNALEGNHELASEFSAGLDSTVIYASCVKFGAIPKLFVHDHPPASTHAKRYNARYEKAFMTRFNSPAIQTVNADNFNALDVMTQYAKWLAGPAGHLFPTFVHPLYEQVVKSRSKILLSGFGGDQCVSFPAQEKFMLPGLLNTHQYKKAWQLARENTSNPLACGLKLMESSSPLAKQFVHTLRNARSGALRFISPHHRKKSTYHHPYHAQYYKSHKEMLWSFLQGQYSYEIRTRIEESSLVAKQLGFEYRYPLLYPPLLEFFFKLPMSMLRNKGQGRYLMKLYLAHKASLPEFMSYQKKEGRSIMSSTVERFKKELASGKYEKDFSDLPYQSHIKHVIANRQASKTAAAYMLKQYLSHTKPTKRNLLHETYVKL